MRMGSWFVIGVSGVSCAGKTSLANNLRDFLTKGEFSDPKLNAEPRFQELNQRIGNGRFRIGAVEVLHQDNYFLPEELQENVELLDHKNWELISGIDMKGMCMDVESILRRDMTYQLPDGNIVQNVINILIIEGFTIFHSPFVLELCNLKVHMHLPFEKCFQRRKVRVYDPADVIGYFEMCVWPEYEKYFRERIKDRKDIRLLNGELSKADLNAYVLNMVGNVFKF